jgi:hypothetical protein
MANKAVKVRVAHLVDDSHPSLAETRENLVMPDLLAHQE